jgi:hypothetical protein
MTVRIAAAVLGAWLFGCSMANAQATELFAYPDKGQSEAQQHKDHVDCGGWAARQSGSVTSDPGATASPQAEHGERWAGGWLRSYGVA